MFLTAAASMYFARPTESVAVIWPPDALMLALLLRSERKARGPLLLAGCIGIVGAGWMLVDTLPVALMLGLCNSVGILVSLLLFTRAAGETMDLTRARTFVKFLLICGGIGPCVSAAGGALVLGTFNGAPQWIIFYTWFAASSLGVLTITPLLMMMRTSEWSHITAKSNRLRAIGILFLVAAVSGGTYLQNVYPLRFVAFPFLILAAFHLRFVGAALAIAIFASISIPMTLAGYGAASLVESTSPAERVLLLQLYLAMCVFTVMPIAAVLTGRRQLERQALAARRAAERANAAKSAFLTNMSHELRTPMTGILGMCDLLLAGNQAPEQRSIVETLERSARSFLELLNDLLDLAKIEAGRMDLESADFRVSQVMKDVQEFFAPAMSQKGLAFSVHCNPGRHDVLSGDAKRLRQVLFNLVGNALKFTDAGSVVVHCRQGLQDDGTVMAEFEVRDTGIGMSMEAQGRLFRPFEQEDSSTSRRFGGTGLGLNISKQIVEAMGGTIAVRSARGKGSTFSFQLPFVPGVAEQIEHRYAITPARIGDVLKGRKLKILYAEDNATTQFLVREVMEMWGHSVEVADNGDKAVAKARAESYDVILLDMQMPVMDGVEAARAIRGGNAHGANVPIIALTADAIPENHARYVLAGCDAVVTKPIEWSVLAREIKAVIAGPTGHAGALETEAGMPVPGTLPVFDRQRIDGLAEGLGPAVLAALLARCLAGFEQYYTDVVENIATGDLPKTRRAAHDLKSVCAQFGALKASEIARSIEAELPDLEAMRTVLADLRMALDQGAAAISSIHDQLPADRSAA
jgi:signal transduction histidine kinase/FixJ family two-component response regulator